MKLIINLDRYIFGGFDSQEIMEELSNGADAGRFMRFASGCVLRFSVENREEPTTGFWHLLHSLPLKGRMEEDDQPAGGRFFHPCADSGITDGNCVVGGFADAASVPWEDRDDYPCWVEGNGSGGDVIDEAELAIGRRRFPFRGFAEYLKSRREIAEAAAERSVVLCQLATTLNKRE